MSENGSVFVLEVTGGADRQSRVMDVNAMQQEQEQEEVSVDTLVNHVESVGRAELVALRAEVHALKSRLKPLQNRVNFFDKIAVIIPVQCNGSQHRIARLHDGRFSLLDHKPSYRQECALMRVSNIKLVGCGAYIAETVENRNSTYHNNPLLDPKTTEVIQARALNHSQNNLIPHTSFSARVAAVAEIEVTAACKRMDDARKVSTSRYECKRFIITDGSLSIRLQYGNSVSIFLPLHNWMSHIKRRGFAEVSNTVILQVNRWHVDNKTPDLVMALRRNGRGYRLAEGRLVRRIRDSAWRVAWVA